LRRAGGLGNRNKVFLPPSPPPADFCTKDNKNIDGSKLHSIFDPAEEAVLKK